ncbi:MAG: thioredoxin [Nitriliruptor sp.]|nr:MAG: thioredoxin [Nitriliruptor sp.]
MARVVARVRPCSAITSTAASISCSRRSSALRRSVEPCSGCCWVPLVIAAPSGRGGFRPTSRWPGRGAWSGNLHQTRPDRRRGVVTPTDRSPGRSVGAHRPTSSTGDGNGRRPARVPHHERDRPRSHTPSPHTRGATVATPQDLTADDFRETIDENEIVLVDFWADWCGPCKMFAPIYEETAAAFEDVVFGKVDTEEQQELAAAFQIRSIPTLMAFRDNVLVFNQAGVLPKESLVDLIEQIKGLDMEDVHRQIAEQEQQAAKN